MFTSTINEASSSILLYLNESLSFNNESVALLCPIDSDISIQSQDYSGSMQQGDLLLLKRPGFCQLKSNTRSHLLMVFFDYIFFMENFKEDFPRLYVNTAIHPTEADTAIRSEVVRLALAHTLDHQDNRFLIQTHIFQLFHVMKADYLMDQPEPVNNTELSPKQAAKLEQFTNYLKDNFSASLALQDVADYMGYTPQYLSNFLKKTLGITFNAYLNNLRLDAAVSLLKFRDYSMEQISFITGFSNVSAFNRVFRAKYITTPEQFRKDFRNSIRNGIDTNDIISDAAFIRDYLTSNLQPADTTHSSIIENVQKLDVTCNVHHSSPLKPVWQDVINLGFARDFESPYFREHITQLQNELHFTYGRVMNIMSIVSVYYADSEKHFYDFTQAFQIIDYLMDIGLKPFLDLGDKAPTIYLTGSHITIAPVKDFDEMFREMLPEFIKSCINRYSYDQVSTWRFELWRRYENRISSVLEPLEHFQARFSYAYEIIKSMVPLAGVGGPGFNSVADISLLKEWLVYTRQCHVIPDFITAYIYPYAACPDSDPDMPEIKLHSDENYFSANVDLINQIRDALGMNDVPLFITEFSLHVMQRNHFNDSMYQAAFLLKQFLSNWKHTDSMCYWLATDYSIDYPDCKTFLFGGNGILTRHGIKKSGYHAFGFLSMLGKDLIKQADNYIITHSFDDNYQVLIYNYAHFTKEYCRHPDWFEPAQFADVAFEEKEPIQITLTMTGITPGKYKVSRHSIISTTGTVYHEWGRLNYSTDLTPLEMSHMRNACVPDLTITEYIATDSLIFSARVSRNESALITIERIF